MDTIDPQVKNLVSAIGHAETGDPSPAAYTQKGASGEFGRYQFMPETYKSYAKKYLGDENAEPTIENQNKIAYSFVDEKKKAGYNPAQIASMWNAGESKPDAYKENYKGINSAGVAYDTPAYVQKVSDYYNQSKGQSNSLSTSVPQNQPVDQQKEALKSQGEPVSVQDNRATPTLGGSIVRGLVKPFAKIATNIVQTGETAAGKPLTEPFSGGYLGRVQPVGARKDATVEQGVTTASAGGLALRSGLTGLEVGADLANGEGLASAGKTIATKGISGLLKGASALENPEVANILKTRFGSTAAKSVGNLPKAEVVNTLAKTLEELSIDEAKGTKGKAIAKALQELTPTTAAKQSLLKRFAKGAMNEATRYVLYNALGSKLGGLIHGELPK